MDACLPLCWVRTTKDRVARAASPRPKGDIVCTSIRFNDKSGHMYLGRNLDWSCGYGERVVVTPRGFKPASPFGVTPMKISPVPVADLCTI